MYLQRGEILFRLPRKFWAVNMLLAAVQIWCLLLFCLLVKTCRAELCCNYKLVGIACCLGSYARLL